MTNSNENSAKQVTLLSSKESSAKQVSLLSKLPVLNQKHLGSCFTNAVCSAMEYAQLRENADRELIQPSRIFMYRLSEQYGLARITGIPAKSGDSGGLSNAVATLIKSFGVCSSRYLPYPDDNFFAQATKEEINALLNAAPTSVQLEMAKKQLQEFEYYSVLQTIDNLSRKVSLSVVDPCDNFKEIKSSINPIDFFKWSIEELDLPVCIGIPIFSNWGLTDASQFGIIDMPAANDTIEGGHAVLAVGYNDDYVFPSGAKGAIIFQNSWGEAWPAHNVYGSCAGLGLLPYDLFDRYSLGISYGPIVTKCSMIDTVEGHFLGELIAN